MKFILFFSREYELYKVDKQPNFADSDNIKNEPGLALFYGVLLQYVVRHHQAAIEIIAQYSDTKTAEPPPRARSPPHTLHFRLPQFFLKPLFKCFALVVALYEKV